MQRVKTYLLMVHIAGWLLFMAFPLLFLNGNVTNGSRFLLLQSPNYWIFCFTYALLFYINGYFLIPRFFLKKKHFQYWSAILLLLVGVFFLKPYDRLVRAGTDYYRPQGYQNPPLHAAPAPCETMPQPMAADKQAPGPMRDQSPGEIMPPPPPADNKPGQIPLHNHPPGGPGPFRGNMPPHFGPPAHRDPMRFDSTSWFLFVMIIALSTVIKIIEQWQLTEQRASRAEADKASAELSFLKAQINPHFLFNTLNNIYTLTVIKDDNAPDSIMKLSNIMRYVTDEAMEDFVPLQSELDCVKDYIELQRLRIGGKTTVDLHVSGETENKKIAPLILMTFIENVFKYGISKHEKSAILIDVLAAGGSIIFYCENSIFSENKHHERNGVGLKNVQKRLEYLYPGSYSLSITSDNNLYKVKLTLDT